MIIKTTVNICIITPERYMSHRPTQVVVVVAVSSSNNLSSEITHAGFIVTGDVYFFDARGFFFREKER